MKLDQTLKTNRQKKKKKKKQTKNENNFQMNRSNNFSIWVGHVSYANEIKMSRHIEYIVEK